MSAHDPVPNIVREPGYGFTIRVCTTCGHISPNDDEHAAHVTETGDPS